MFVDSKLSKKAKFPNSNKIFNKLEMKYTSVPMIAGVFVE